MLSLIKKVIFHHKMKTTTAAQVFLILFFYMILTSIYGYLLLGLTEFLVRLVIGFFMVSSFVFCERSKISVALAAFLAPALLQSAIFFGAVYSGDILVYLCIIGAAMISLTYLNPKSLLLYLIYSICMGSILVFGFGVNMLGEPYSFVHNGVYIVASLALGFLVYVFCGFYTRTIDSLVEAEANAMEAAKAKSSFLAQMSHEIRTPLNAVIGLTEIQLRKPLHSDEKEALTKIQASGTLLLGIINDILDLSKIESGKFDLIPSDYMVADLLYDVSTLNMVRIGSKPLSFFVVVDPTIPCRLCGDSLRVKQLLNNLLSNAFKYSNEGSITLALSWSMEGDQAHLVFSVADTGIGIAPEDLKLLFSEYAQVNQQAHKTVEGTGLGLSISKRLTELMGGRIYAESEYGKGSVFTAEILQDISDQTPLGDGAAAALASFTYKPEPETTLLAFTPMPYAKVLIVDDVEINLMVAEALMEPYGMTVDCMDNGYDAVEKIKVQDLNYDLVFMDQMMPGMDGLETVTAIREIGTDYAKNLPIIALSANAIAGSEKMFLENGFQDFLAKPIDQHKLDEILRKWILHKSRHL